MEEVLEIALSIILSDEVTSELDNESEQPVNNVMKRLQGGKAD